MKVLTAALVVVLVIAAVLVVIAVESSADFADGQRDIQNSFED